MSWIVSVAATFFIKLSMLEFRYLVDTSGPRSDRLGRVFAITSTMLLLEILEGCQVD